MQQLLTKMVLGANLWLVSTLVAAATVTINFPKDSYELAPAQAAKLTALVASAKADSTVVLSIAERSAGLKAKSLASILERNRSLLMFQACVQGGLDPARITVMPVKGQSGEVSVESQHQAQAPSTPKLIPSAAAAKPSASAADEFVINFPSASAEPDNLSPERLKAFLKAVGQPGHDAAVIEGHTDRSGDAAYNRALGELRALVVYERLVRAGLPPYRIETKGRGGEAESKSSPGAGASQRRVIIRWSKDEAVAKVAVAQDVVNVANVAKVEPVKVEPPVAPAKVAPAAVPQATVTPQAVGADNSGTLDLVPFGGGIMPGGELRNHAKASGTYGLGIGKALWSDAGSEGRVTLFASGDAKLAAKEADRAGDLQIRLVNLRADYAFGGGPVRPFVGVGLGVYSWSGVISQPSSNLTNGSQKNDFGANLTLGLDVVVAKCLIVAPEVAIHDVVGQFSNVLYTGTLNLRFRI